MFYSNFNDLLGQLLKQKIEKDQNVNVIEVWRKECFFGYTLYVLKWGSTSISIELDSSQPQVRYPPKI